MRNSCKKHWLFALAAAWLPGGLCAQGSQELVELQVVRHDLHDKDNLLELYVKATEGGRAGLVSKQNIFVHDKFQDEDSTRLIISDILARDSTVEAGASSGEQFSVLFLTALNNEAFPGLAAQRGELVEAFASRTSLPAGTKYFAADYCKPASPPRQLPSLKELKGVMAGYGEPGSFAELHKGLAESLRFLSGLGGRRVIVLLTDGVDKPNKEAYGSRRELPYDTADLRYFLSSLDPDFLVFPIGIGQADASFLQFVAEATPAETDTFSLQSIPDRLGELLFARRNILYNYLLRLTPNSSHPVFKGEKRHLTVAWGGRQATYDLAGFGSPGNPRGELLSETYTSPGGWLLRFALGLALVLAALGLMSWLVPWLHQHRFRKRYVTAYRERDGVRKRDPLSGELFQEGELVVVKCPHVTSSLATWEYVGNQCPQYPKCLGFASPCEGHGAAVAEDGFFSMKGVFRRLNWLWYGMVGGFLAWCLQALLHSAAYGWYHALVQRLFEQSSAGAGDGIARHVENLASDLVIGTAFGAGICLALSYVEERSQPRRFSWLRVALRTAAGALAALLVFMLGFYLQHVGAVGSRFLAGLLTWVLFGVAAGAVMSVESSISAWKGVVGGVLAAVPAYGVYLLMPEYLFPNDFPLATLASLLVLGAMLGITLVTVVAALEDFELEYLSPEAFRQTIPVSKWLKKNLDVFIGTEQGSYVYVKWRDDAVLPRHARLHFQKGVVFIQPYGETLLNGKVLPLKTNTPLQDGDLLQLGRESVSRMRFREKRKAQAPPPPQQAKGGAQPPAQGQQGGIKIKFKEE